MRATTVILGVILACAPAPIQPDPASIGDGSSARPSIRGTRLIAASSDRAAQPLEVTVSSPLAPGDNATATIRATAGSRCEIEVTYRSGPSEAQGLEPQTVGDDAAVSWSWIIGMNTTPGDWVVAVGCIDADGGVARGHASLNVASREYSPTTRP